MWHFFKHISGIPNSENKESGGKKRQDKSNDMSEQRLKIFPDSPEEHVF